MDLLIYHNTILDLLRKERLDIPTHQVIDEFTHVAQLEFFEDQYKKYGETQEDQDSLAPFKKHIPFTSDSSGNIIYPDDYGHLISVYTITYDNNRLLPVRHKVQFVQEDKLTDALSNQVRSVSVTYPIATNSSNMILLFPRIVQSGGLNYFKLPVAPHLDYSISGRQITYNPSTSTQLLWYDPYCKIIMIKTLGYLGLNIKEADLFQFSQLKDSKS